jgi:DNA-binding transcriptional LysR family regulator
MELRHLRYFIAVVESKGVREASRRLHVAQPAISQTITNLEAEIGVKLLARSGRGIQLTAEGKVFYEETLRTIQQSELAVESAQRASRGEAGKLTIGFCGAATYAFMPDLIRTYKASFPGVKINLLEMTPVQQEVSLAEGSIDAGFTRATSSGESATLNTRLLYRDPLLAALPSCRNVRGRRMKVEDLAKDSFILYHRKGSPAIFDEVIGLCRERGFSPNVEIEPDMLPTVLALVAADQGVSIVPACALTLHFEGVKYLRLQPDRVRAELILAWPKLAQSSVLNSFVEFVAKAIPEIRGKTAIPSSI